MKPQDEQAIRDQFKLAIAFMRCTPDSRPAYGADWWCGNMPAYPDEVPLEDYSHVFRPFWCEWSDYLEELTQAGMGDYRLLAEQLPIADLLAWSHTEEEVRSEY